MMNIVGALDLVPLDPDPSAMMIFNFYSCYDGMYWIEGTYTSEAGTFTFFEDYSIVLEGKIAETIEIYNKHLGLSTIEEICEKPFTPDDFFQYKDPQAFMAKLKAAI